MLQSYAMRLQMQWPRAFIMIIAYEPSVFQAIALGQSPTTRRRGSEDDNLCGC